MKKRLVLNFVSLGNSSSSLAVLTFLQFPYPFQNWGNNLELIDGSGKTSSGAIFGVAAVFLDVNISRHKIFYIILTPQG